MSRMLLPALSIRAVVTLAAVASSLLASSFVPRAPELARPNDNRVAAGRMSANGSARTLVVQLEARWAGWRPDEAVDSAATVRAFAEVGGVATIPGPLLRVRAGTTVELSVSNAMGDSAITVHGLRAGTVADDTIRIAPGATRRIRFTPRAAGTFLYWGETTKRGIGDRWGRDGQLTGAIVVDATDAVVDTAERIFVLTVLDIFADKSRPKTKEDIWEIAINGRSWPHTERLRYTVGDSVHWRFVNGTFLPHPMHLHGFHFRVHSKGNGRTDTTYSVANERLAVTEFMRSGSTFTMAWLPTRAGNWLFHCHMAGHITPFPVPADSVRAHEMHDAELHAQNAMAGLVLGVTSVLPTGAVAESPAVPARSLRLIAVEDPAPNDTTRARARGYVLQDAGEPRVGAIAGPSPEIVLTRGEPTAITVVNRLSQATSVHWHGMEITSVYDGVAGWSGSTGATAPLVAPGDSFRVIITAPRAGTFMYHTHMDAEEQLRDGLYGALIVLEPGATRDVTTERALVIGDVVENGKRVQGINGRHSPAPLELRAGTTYRLRLISIMPVVPADVSLKAGGALSSWRIVAKDGAEIPLGQRRVQPAKLTIGVGETYDLEITPKLVARNAASRNTMPRNVGTMELVVSLPDGLPPITQRIRVR